MSTANHTNRPDKIRGGERKRLIVKVAQSLFIDHGFAGTTVDMICSAARISKRDFYAHFADRDAVFLDVASRLTRMPTPREQALSGSIETVLEKFGERVIVGLDPLALGLFRASISAGSISASLARGVYEARAAGGGDVVDYLSKLKLRGEVTFDDGVKATQRFSFLVLDGLWALMGRPAPDLPTIARRCTEMTAIYLGGHATSALKMRPGLKTPPMTAPQEPAAIRPLPPQKSTRISEERWEGVLTVAWEELRAHGYDGASMATIARKTGIPKNTIYRRFESKTGLFTECGIRLVDRLFDASLFQDVDHGSVVKTLEYMSLLLCRSYCSPDNIALHRLLIVEGGRHPEMSSTIYGHIQRRISDALHPFFRAMASAGLVHGDDASTLAWRFFILSTVGARFLFIQPTPDEEIALAHEAAQLFLFGITQRPGTGRPS